MAGDENITLLSDPCYNRMHWIGEVPERPNGTVSKTVVGLVSTVGSNPTLSAERITFRASSPAATLGE